MGDVKNTTSTHAHVMQTGRRSTCSRYSLSLPRLEQACQPLESLPLFRDFVFFCGLFFFIMLLFCLFFFFFGLKHKCERVVKMFYILHSFIYFLSVDYKSFFFLTFIIYQKNIRKLPKYKYKCNDKTKILFLVYIWNLFLLI